VFLDTIARHVQPDGVYYEHASHYHRYTADFCLHFHILAELNGDTVPHDFRTRTMLLLDHLMHITKPDGATPRYGDDDGGRFVALDESTGTDFRSTLRTGAALFKRADYKYVARLGADDARDDVLAAAEETAWLLGSDGIASLDNLSATPPVETSRAFPASGYCVMRDDWSKDSNYMLFDGAAHGAKGGAHAHADALSFELAAHGRTLLVDPGTYTYTKSPELRDQFRSTAAHNTLTIDGESSSVPATAFAWQHIANVSLEKWITRNALTSRRRRTTATCASRRIPRATRGACCFSKTITGFCATRLRPRARTLTIFIFTSPPIATRKSKCLAEMNQAQENRLK
jgi:hypothetical protein